MNPLPLLLIVLAAAPASAAEEPQEDIVVTADPEMLRRVRAERAARERAQAAAPDNPLADLDPETRQRLREDTARLISDPETCGLFGGCPNGEDNAKSAFGALTTIGNADAAAAAASRDSGSSLRGRTSGPSAASRAAPTNAPLSSPGYDAGLMDLSPELNASMGEAGAGALAQAGRPAPVQAMKGWDAHAAWRAAENGGFETLRNDTRNSPSLRGLEQQATLTDSMKGPETALPNVLRRFSAESNGP